MVLCEGSGGWYLLRFILVFRYVLTLFGGPEVAKENGSYMYTKSWERFNASYD